MVYFIAEIGINHNGDIKIAKDLIKIAKDAGCDAVKFQKRTIDLVYSKEKLASFRESPWGTTERQQKEGLEFGEKEYNEIDNFCKKKNIDWFASAWDLNSQKFLKKYDLKYNKIASAMIIDLNFLKVVALEKKHTFISTGMCEIEDIDKAVSIFRENNCSFELMHCVSTYPTKDEDNNLNVIRTLREKFKCNVGFSGHEGGVAITIAAAALGATSIERHITLNRSMYGSDQAASLEPSGLRFLVGAVKKIPKAMGDGLKKFLKEEVLISKKLREHIKNKKINF
jgi:N-acetylneuraminate synthase